MGPLRSLLRGPMVRDTNRCQCGRVRLRGFSGSVITRNGRKVVVHTHGLCS